MFDLLSDILAGLRFQASSYFCTDFAGDWGIDSGGKAQGEFHIVLRGQAWVMLPGSEPCLLSSGDVVLVPAGDCHRIAATPHSSTVGGGELVAELHAGHNRFSEGLPGVTLLCGNFQYSNRQHPLLSALPKLIHLQERQSPLLAGLRHLVVSLAGELQHQPQGAALIRDRLTEVLIIQLLRLYIEEQPERPFLAAFSDRSVARALSLMHEQVAENWTVESLAHAVGMSRSAFSARFQQQVGDAPMNYLLQWRMQQAKLMLEAGERSIPALAERLGYSSEAAFRKAFRRVVGVPPGQVRSI